MSLSEGGGGKVFLVGAGPGAGGLLTVRGRALLETADIVVHDRLVSPGLLQSLPPAARLVDAGKSPGERAVSQEAIHRLLIAEARAGKKVVRLKGGDPFLFGRGGEEALALSEAGVPWEFVPGVSSALAVPGLAGIPLTLRGVSSSLHILTWRGSGGEAPRRERLEALARAGGSLVILMGGAALGEMGASLIRAGFPAGLPAAVIENGSLPGQKVTRLTLESLAAWDAPVSRPVLVAAGEVCALAERLGGLPVGIDSVEPVIGGNLPAFWGGAGGWRVVVTRPEPGNGETCRLVRASGGRAIPFPCLKIVPAAGFPSTLPGFLSGRGARWLVFSSAAGVRCFFDGLRAAAFDLRGLASAKFAAVGPATAEALAARGFLPDFVPPFPNGRSLGEGLAERMGEGGWVLLAGAAKSASSLPDTLHARAVPFERLVLYDAVPAQGGAAASRAILAGDFDFVLFASAGAVSAFAAFLSRHKGVAADFPAVKALCAGASAAKRAGELGMEVRVLPCPFTSGALAAACL